MNGVKKRTHLLCFFKCDRLGKDCQGKPDDMTIDKKGCREFIPLKQGVNTNKRGEAS